MDRDNFLDDLSAIALESLYEGLKSFTYPEPKTSSLEVAFQVLMGIFVRLGILSESIHFLLPPSKSIVCQKVIVDVYVEVKP